MKVTLSPSHSSDGVAATEGAVVAVGGATVGTATDGRCVAVGAAQAAARSVKTPARAVTRLVVTPPFLL
jgi:hypothetical protein